MGVITISRELGSEGDRVADIICETLGYCRVDKDVLAHIAEDTGLDSETLAQLEEEITKKPRFVSADMTSLYRKQPGAFQKDLAMSEEAYKKVLRDAMEKYAREGDAVIVGRGSQMILRDWPDVLHVQLYASPEVRTRRIMKRLGISEADAARQIQSSDEYRRRYIRHMHDNANWKRMDYYHLAIDTARICPDVAARIIVDAAHSRGEEHGACV